MIKFYAIYTSLKRSKSYVRNRNKDNYHRLMKKNLATFVWLQYVINLRQCLYLGLPRYACMINNKKVSNKKYISNINANVITYNKIPKMTHPSIVIKLLYRWDISLHYIICMNFQLASSCSQSLSVSTY